MKIVSNTSPLIFLSKLDRLDLLGVCFAEVSIPKSVKDETLGLVLPKFISCLTVSDIGEKYVQNCLGTLHRGELEAIALAQDMKADLILLDDLKARYQAGQHGLSVMGTVGVLLLANTQGHVTAERTACYYDDLIKKHGLYLSEEILKRLKDSLI